MDLANEMASDAAALEQLDQEKLNQVSELVAAIREQARYVEQVKEELKTAKDWLEQLETKRLPDLMAELGLSELRLVDGARLTIKTEYYAGITAQNREAAFNWLTEHGHDDIIKGEVKAKFGRGETALFEAVKDAIDSLGVDCTATKNIHPQTLKAFVKEQLEAGQPLPEQLFSVHTVNKATIK